MGKGVAGVVLKPTAGENCPPRSTFYQRLTPFTAILGVPGYTYKGIYRELRKSRGKPVEDFLVAGRVAEGIEDWETSTELEREQIVSRWREIEPEIRKAITKTTHPTVPTAAGRSD